MASPKIAILEDDDDTRAMYAALVEAAGYEPLPISTGAQLLSSLRQTKESPAAIIMDLGLPDAQGVPLCRMIRAHERFRRVPIIAVTGWTSGPYVRGLSDAAFNEVFVKPVDTGMLLEALRRWVSAVGAV